MISETGKVKCRRSSDNGRSWGPAIVISNHPGTDDRDAFAHQTKDGTVWVGSQGQRFENYDAYVIRSFDNGSSWEEPTLVSRSHDEFFIEYPMCEMTNGEFLWIGCTGFSKTDEAGNKLWFAGKAGNHRATFILKEREKEFVWESFTHPQLRTEDEWDVVELDPGHLIAILRDTDKEQHYFFQSESYDYGRTWAEARPTTIWHSPSSSRPMIDKTETGTLIVSYAERMEGRILAIPSYDDGKSWENDRIVTILDNPAYCNPKSGDFSYPAVADAGEDYLFIYYAFPGHESKHRGIYGSFVPKTTFEKQEV